MNAFCKERTHSLFLTKTVVRVMQLTAILLLTACLQVSASGLSQTVTFSGKEVPLEKVLGIVQEQTGFKILSSAKKLKEARPVTINAISKPLTEFLDDILKDQPLEYVIQQNTIFIRKKSETSVPRLTPRLDLDAPPITGIVRGPDGKPLAGINVVVKNSNKGVVTDGNGQFSIDAEPGSSLLISSIGYSQQEIKISANQSYLNISMTIATSPLDEIQVIAYGTNSRRLNTGNVTTVSSKEIETQPISNPLSALQGRVPGMVITQNTGVPGGSFSVQIRGRNSIANVGDPLYVIDGVPYTSQLLPNNGLGILGNGSSLVGYGNPLNLLNPLDIESISVLKDADATAIYGSRGANGVVLISTKHGKSGRMRADVNASIGLSQARSKLKYLSTPKYLQLRREALANDGVPDDMIQDPDLKIWDTAKDTDWENDMIGNTGKYSSVQASASGGGPNSQILISGTYRKQTTVFPGDFFDQSGNLHLNLKTFSADKRFQLSFSANYMIDENKLPPGDFTRFIALPPNAPNIYNEDGSLNWADGTWPLGNPYYLTKQKYQINSKNLVSNLSLTYTLPFGLQFKTSFGYTNMQIDEVKLLPISSLNPLGPTKTGESFFTNNNIHSWIIEPQLNYSKDTRKIHFDVTLGSTIQQNKSLGQIDWGSGYISDVLLLNPQAAPTLKVSSFTDNLYKYIAGFGRISLNYSDKYLLNITGRRDGSSRFGSNNRFHNFGSIGIGWIFTQESFFKDKLSFLSFGKIRGSFGTTGSDQISDYRYYDLFNPYPLPYQGFTTLNPAGLSNPSIAWEETKKMEGSIDLGVLKDRLLINITYYNNRSSNQLIDYTLPATAGFGSIAANLPALIQNSGWEFQLNSVNIGSGSFKWNSSFNLTIATNKLVRFADLDITPFKNTLVLGQPLTIQKVFQFSGVNDTTGLYEFTNIKGTKTSAPEQFVDNLSVINLTPKYYGGFSNTISYANFELSFLIQFVKQIGLSPLFQTNIAPGMFGTNNLTQLQLNRWQTPGDPTEVQKLTSTFADAYNAYYAAKQSDAAYTDASFIRIKNANVSYRLAGNVLKKLRLQGCTFSAGVQNLFTFTKYKGVDPETQGNAVLPPLRTILVGIALSF